MQLFSENLKHKTTSFRVACEEYSLFSYSLSQKLSPSNLLQWLASEPARFNEKIIFLSIH